MPKFKLIAVGTIQDIVQKQVSLHEQTGRQADGQRDG